MTRATRLVAAVVFLAVVALSVVGAQPPAPSAGGEAVDPIRCWWRTSRGAVATGEPFEASLTCATLEDANLRVVTDESRLGAAAVQLQPFEVLGGRHPADLRTSSSRLFQYHYTLRIIDRDVVGGDARFPDLRIPYRVQSRVNGDMVEGRDRTYVVPGESVRVLSLVPPDAGDIRDSVPLDFAGVESLRFQSRALDLAALVLVALGVLVLAQASMRTFAGPARVKGSGATPPAAHAVLARVADELAAVRRESQHGWSTDLVARAAAATRLAAACAVGHRLAHRSVAAAGVGQGLLTMTRGWVRKTTVALASPLTAAVLARELEQLPASASVERRHVLESLYEALALFTATLYGAAGVLDASQLDAALASAREATERVQRQHGWPRRLLRRRDEPAAIAAVRV
ncbi:MAG: hypothetical protein ACT4QD_07050 [Acidobacteriota bacterium]